MARLDEIAEGLATLLVQSASPEPLQIDLRGEGPSETTFLVRAVIDACERRGRPLARVIVSHDLGAGLLKLYAGTRGYGGVSVEQSAEFTSAIRFHRF